MEETLFPSKVSKAPKFAVFLACALKLAVTIPTWAQRARQTSFYEFLALANSTLTDWMLFIVATYVLLHYLRKHNTGSQQKRRRYTSISSNISTSSRRSGSSAWSGSNITVRSNTSYMTLSSVTTSVIDRHTQASPPMEQFLKCRDEYFLTAKGMVEGSFGELGGARVWNSGAEYGRLEALLEQSLE
ncbi:hypothetical protein TWF506_005754 [Arthrobotrys conoides]|uniref:Uncharacterized protein n=1 Tax=Arthrobotrys conoides TaxID=74498 RepID=A0AAN8NJU6_9PEZI